MKIEEYEIIKNYLTKFDNYQAERIIYGFKNLTHEQMEVLSQPELINDQMLSLIRCFEYGATIEEVSMYAKPWFTGGQMETMNCGFRSGLTMEQMRVIYYSNFDEFQMMEAIKGFQNGLTIEQVKIYAYPYVSWEEMERRRLKLEGEL